LPYDPDAPRIPWRETYEDMKWEAAIHMQLDKLVVSDARAQQFIEMRHKIKMRTILKPGDPQCRH